MAGRARASTEPRKSEGERELGGNERAREGEREREGEGRKREREKEVGEERER